MGRFCVLTLSEDNVAYTNPIANCIDTYNRPSIFTTVKTYLYTTGALGSPLTTQSYTYNSQNQRTDLGYDASGNLTSLNGYTFTWSGRRLTAAVNANTDISYTYNHNGIRTSKTVNGITTYYEVDENNNVVKQYELVNDAETNVIEFVYDSSNSPIYFTYNNATYYYEKNLQGDIVAILDSSGNTVVEYTYDIWGKSVSITGTLADTVGTINPLRYRGYYYDTETQLYYLQSRYYSPHLMRFISQDDPVLSNDQGQPLGSNLYVYCLNNSTIFFDPFGNDAIYVTDYNSSSGIPIIGHSILCFQDNKGVWYYTEYTGSTKKNAKVYTKKIDSKAQKRLFGNINRNYIATYGTKIVYIKGDYSGCLSKAQYYATNNFGKYNLITNNCLTYVKKILTYGKYSFGLKLIYNSKTIIAPNAFGNALISYYSLKIAQSAFRIIMNNSIRYIKVSRF